MAARYGGPDNAGKTLVLDQGADVTVVGNSLSQMDFSGVSAAGIERILAAAGVPASWSAWSRCGARARLPGVDARSSRT